MSYKFIVHPAVAAQMREAGIWNDETWAESTKLEALQISVDPSEVYDPSGVRWKDMISALNASCPTPANAAVATTVSAPCEHTTDDGNCWCDPTFHDGVWVHNRTDN